MIAAHRLALRRNELPDIPVVTAPATVVASGNGEPHTNGTNGAPVTNGVPPITLLPVIIPQIAAGQQAKAPWSPTIFVAIITAASTVVTAILTVGGLLLSNHLSRIQDDVGATQQAVAEVIEVQEVQGLAQVQTNDLLVETKASVDGNYSDLQQQLVDARTLVDEFNARAQAESELTATSLATALEQIAGLQLLLAQMAAERLPPTPEPQSDLADPPTPHRTSGRVLN